jgi:hypothetical protein
MQRAMLVGTLAAMAAVFLSIAPARSHDPVACAVCGRAAKIDPSFEGKVTCQPPREQSANGFLQFAPAPDRAEKAVSVAALVGQALADQRPLLRAKAAELTRWDARDRTAFATWFGITNERARDLVRRRVAILLKINEAYSVDNFRRATPSRPGVYAFVHPTDPSRVFLDRQFVHAPRIGASSQAGTITHEMSHFVIAGGTQDFTYGPANCKALARRDPVKALTNADSFEFYVENVR